MWPRVVELMLGLWLAASPFIFRHPGDQVMLWVNDLGGALAVVTFSLASFWKPAQWAHWLTGLVALWLVGFAYFGFDRPGPAGAQNEITVGLLLLMMFFLPNEANLPPEEWREYYAKKGK